MIKILHWGAQRTHVNQPNEKLAKLLKKISSACIISCLHAKILLKDKESPRRLFQEKFLVWFYERLSSHCQCSFIESLAWTKLSNSLWDVGTTWKTIKRTVSRAQRFKHAVLTLQETLCWSGQGANVLWGSGEDGLKMWPDSPTAWWFFSFVLVFFLVIIPVLLWVCLWKTKKERKKKKYSGKILRLYEAEVGLTSMSCPLPCDAPVLA